MSYFFRWVCRGEGLGHVDRLYVRSAVWRLASESDRVLLPGPLLKPWFEDDWIVYNLSAPALVRNNNLIREAW